MIVWVLCVLISIGILVAILLYRYENSDFSKITGYSYLKIWTNKDVRLRFNLFRILNKVPGHHKLLLNVKLSVEQNRMIDCIFVHTSGIYVIDLKEASGWIFGREQDLEWAQAIHRDKVTKFANPIIKNQQSILLLQQLLPKVEVNLIHSLIVFSNDCSFSKIEVESNDIEVVKMNEVKSCVLEEKGVALTNDQINNIYSALEKEMDFTEPIRKPTIQNVGSNFN